MQIQLPIEISSVEIVEKNSFVEFIKKVSQQELIKIFKQNSLQELTTDHVLFFVHNNFGGKLSCKATWHEMRICCNLILEKLDKIERFAHLKWKPYKYYYRLKNCQNYRQLIATAPVDLSWMKKYDHTE